MSTWLHNWILSVVGAALLSALALALTPEGRCRSVVRLLCGVVTALAVLRPLGQIDLEVYSMSMAAYREQAEAAVRSGEESNDRLSRSIIEQETAAYIWDKAQAAGLMPEEVTVTAKWGDTLCWYPYEVHLRGEAGADGREQLARIMESELGIPRERQHWESPAAGTDTAEGGV